VGNPRLAHAGTLDRVRFVRRLLRHRLAAELATFGLVGAICLATDIVLFNVLVFGADLAPVPAKIITMAITGTMSFFGHRHVTFRGRKGAGLSSEVFQFTALTALSLVAGLAPLWLVRNVADLGGPIWLNAANIVGIALGAGLRYVAYRQVVWAQAPVVAASDQTVSVPSSERSV
jgi:putative flippase GtrA